MLCVFSQEQIGRGHVYIDYTQKVLEVLLLSTPKKYFFVRVKCDFIIFAGKFFLYVLLQTKIVIAPGGENNVSLRHSPRHLLPGGEACMCGPDAFTHRTQHFFSTAQDSVIAERFEQHMGEAGKRPSLLCSTLPVLLLLVLLLLLLLLLYAAARCVSVCLSPTEYVCFFSWCTCVCFLASQDSIITYMVLRYVPAQYTGTRRDTTTN